MMRLIAAALLLALSGCATATSAATEKAYHVMRHLNTPEGERDPDLTDEGQRSAQLLAARFAQNPPTAIYVSSYKRTQQTAAPLAARLGITPKVYDPANTPALVQQVRAEPGTVLIVGHSNTVPDIIEQLGGQRPAPLVHADFGDIWTIRGTRRTVTRAKLGGS